MGERRAAHRVSRGGRGRPDRRDVAPPASRRGLQRRRGGWSAVPRSHPGGAPSRRRSRVARQARRGARPRIYVQSRVQSQGLGPGRARQRLARRVRSQRGRAPAEAAAHRQVHPRIRVYTRDGCAPRRQYSCQRMRRRHPESPRRYTRRRQRHPDDARDVATRRRQTRRPWGAVRPRRPRGWRTGD